LPPETTPLKSAGRYEPNYPVCMEVYDTTGGRLECRYATYEQCRQFTFGSGGTCFNNPSYVAPPPPPAPVQAEPAPPPAKPVKRVKSAKAAKPPQPPPLPASAQSAPPQPAPSR
jgi:hypothetical protein